MSWQADNGQQLYCLFLSCGFGFCLALVYELFGWCRHRARHALAVAFWDVFYVVAAAVALFIFALPLTGGRLRWYILLGAALGFVACRRTVGRLLHVLYRLLSIGFRAVCRWLKRLFLPFLRMVSRPMTFLAEKGKNFLKKREEKCKKLLQQDGNVVYNQNKNG